MIKITPADHWFSKCVRERSNWTCEKCGTKYIPPTQALHCSHFEGRSNWATRFEPINATALCYGCHQYIGSKPKTHIEFIEKIFGAGALDIIEEKANNLMLAKEVKRTNGKGEIANHYKSEYERMRMIRDNGFEGRIEFTGWL